MLKVVSRQWGSLGKVAGLSQRCVYSSVASLPEMPPCDFKPQPYNGMSYEKATEVRKTNMTQAIINGTYYKNPVMIDQGHMQWLFDINGKRYLDLFAGIVTVSVGHCHPKVAKAAFDQMNKLWHTTNIYMHPQIHEYAERLTAKLPPGLDVVYFTNSGSEANDLALMLARMHTGCYDIISLRNAYHGASPYTMGLTSLSTWHYNYPAGFGIHQTMNPDPYRGHWGGKNCRDSPVQTTNDCDCAEGECKACDKYCQELDDVMNYCLPKVRVGGMFIESIQGVGGTMQFPKEFTKRAFEAVRAKGGVCLSDEVQTGFGRTGDHYWGFEGHGVVPDIVTMAKGMGNGFPLAAVVTTKEIASSMGQCLHFNTFGGNPMACAVGTAVLDAIEEDGCQQTSLTVGTYFLNELAKLRDEFDFVGDVRGKGLMIGVELVADQASKNPMPAEDVLHIWERCKDLGVLLGKGGYYGTVLRIKPPMCITKEDVDFAIAVMRQACTEFQDQKTSK